MTSFFSAAGGPIWIKFRRLAQNDMSTAVKLKSKPKVEFQYGGRLGEFNGMSSQSHLPPCRVLPPGEFSVMIPELRVTLQEAATGRIQWHVISEPHITLQSAVTWRNQCHDRATLQGVRIQSAVLKIVFCHILFFVFFIERQHTVARYWYSKSVCPSVRLSVHYVPVLYENGLTYCHSFFSPYGSAIILVLPASNIFTNSDGVTPCGGDKYRWGIKVSRFSTKKWLYLADDTR